MWNGRRLELLESRDMRLLTAVADHVAAVTQIDLSYLPGGADMQL